MLAFVVVAAVLSNPLSNPLTTRPPDHPGEQFDLTSFLLAPVLSDGRISLLRGYIALAGRSPPTGRRGAGDEAVRGGRGCRRGS